MFGLSFSHTHTRHTRVEMGCGFLLGSLSLERLERVSLQEMKGSGTPCGSRSRTEHLLSSAIGQSSPMRFERNDCRLFKTVGGHVLAPHVRAVIILAPFFVLIIVSCSCHDLNKRA